MVTEAAPGTGTTDATANTTEAPGTAKDGGTNTGTQAATGADGKAGTGDVAQDGKTADGTTQAGSSNDGGKDGDGKPAPKAPENYELKVPEGVSLTKIERARVEEIARANDWTNEEAQVELDAQIAISKAAHAERTEAYLADTKADPEIGGDKFEETLRLSTEAMDRIAPKGSKDGDAFRAYLDETGAGNNPVVVRVIRRLGKMLQEDRPGGDAGGGNQPKDAAAVLYGEKA